MPEEKKKINKFVYVKPLLDDDKEVIGGFMGFTWHFGFRRRKNKKIQKTYKYNRRIEKLKEKGAVLGGIRRIDKKYTRLSHKFVKYLLHLGEEELLALMGTELIQKQTKI